MSDKIRFCPVLHQEVYPGVTQHNGKDPEIGIEGTYPPLKVSAHFLADTTPDGPMDPTQECFIATRLRSKDFTGTAGRRCQRCRLDTVNQFVTSNTK